MENHDDGEADNRGESTFIENGTSPNPEPLIEMPELASEGAGERQGGWLEAEGSSIQYVVKGREWGKAQGEGALV